MQLPVTGPRVSLEVSQCVGRETEIESSRALGHANTVFWRANIKLGINNLYKRYEFYRSGVRNYFVSDKGKFFNMKEGIDMDWTIKFYQLLRDEVGRPIQESAGKSERRTGRPVTQPRKFRPLAGRVHRKVSLTCFWGHRVLSDKRELVSWYGGPTRRSGGEFDATRPGGGVAVGLEVFAAVEVGARD